MNPDERSNVLIFRRELLPYSETFIVEQARSLRRYFPVLLGTRRGDRDPKTLPVPAATVGPSWFAKVNELALMYGGMATRMRAEMRRADIVHAHFGPDASLLVPALTRVPYRPKPFVATFHGYDAIMTDDELRALGRFASAFVDGRAALFERANTLVAVSEFVRDELVRAGAEAPKIIVHYIGIDTAFFWARERPSPPPPTVLFLGRLHAQKGCADLLRALARVPAETASVRCVVAGTGTEARSLAALATELRLDVQFVGAVDANQARELLHSARVLCVPSIREGFGLVFAEAQACGVPVVAYRSGGVSEAVADGETGLLATERDVDGLAQRLGTLLTDDETWRRMSVAGRARTARAFDLTTQTAALEDVYDQTRRASACR
jgi:glycosyltransferase involved in cell wall biosynthesis